jgi:phosphoserine aminotransferase
MNKQISSFNDINITKKNTLILCDIDDTILYYPECISKCLEIMQDLKIPFSTQEESKTEFNMLCNYYKIINKPTHTDYIGFINMVNKIKELNSKLLFLTARNKSSHNKTKEQLLHVGISCDDNDIHYTNNVTTKGEYIQNNININEWDEIIFIDDYLSYIKSVNDIFPNIICYNFIVKT